MPHLAPSLAALRSEINAAYPGRLTSSDGWIGDAAHAARKSDHNPDSQGWVRALDVSEWDPYTPQIEADDVAEALADHLRSTQDNRVAYIIWRGRICSSTRVGAFRAWGWRPYSGPNGHFIHCHVSVTSTPAGLDPRPWGFRRPGAGTAGGIAPGAQGEHVRFLEAMLNVLAAQRINVVGRPGGRLIATNGTYDAETTEAVRELQRFLRVMGQLAGTPENDLVAVSGRADALTLAQLGWWATQIIGGAR